MSVHKEYTEYTLKHLLLRHMYNFLLPNLRAALLVTDVQLSSVSVLLLISHSLCSLCYYCYCTTAPALYCAVLYIVACVDASRMVFWDRSVAFNF